MRCLIGKRYLKNRELRYFVTKDKRRGYGVEICEITYSRKKQFLCQDNPSGFKKALKFAKQIKAGMVLPEHLKNIADDFKTDGYI